MSELRILETAEERLLTRPLYEQAFEDPERFVDYYYREKCRDNTIIAEFDDSGLPLSMVHLNPYRMSVCGTEVPTCYLVAVATDSAHRHQGHMTAVMNRAYRLMEEAKIPFCWLLPVDPAIYSWMGFRTICDFQKRTADYETIRADYEVYCVQDDTYRFRASEEARLSEEGNSEVLPDHPVIMAKVICRESFDAMAGRSFPDDEARLEWLAEKKIYICEEV